MKKCLCTVGPHHLDCPAEPRLEITILDAALLHETEERRDIERVLGLIERHDWRTEDGEYLDLADTVEKIMWRRKAMAGENIK